MKTVNALKEANVIVNGEVVETVKMENPCQMWKQLDSLFAKHGGTARIQVVYADGGLYKDFTLVTLKNGKTQKVNAIKETNRGMMAKAKKARIERELKEAAKKAKKRAYDKARRERIKAQKAAQAAAVVTEAEPAAVASEAI